jgi:hypothetical protein
MPERSAGSIVFTRDAESMDYTTVPEGWQIVGQLSTGHLTKSTIRCRKCGRLGVLATSNSGRLIVHRGLVSHENLHPTDYCELSIAVH